MVLLIKPCFYLFSNHFHLLTEKRFQRNGFQTFIMPGQIVFVNEVPDILVPITQHLYLFLSGNASL